MVDQALIDESRLREMVDDILRQTIDREMPGILKKVQEADFGDTLAIKLRLTLVLPQEDCNEY